MRWICVLFFLCAASLPIQAQQWQIITEELIQKEKPGYGKLCGVAVHRATGDVYINLSDKGLYRSADLGQSWRQVGKQFKGRTETPGCLQLDPMGGKRLIIALVYGSPILVGQDLEENLNPLDKKSAHVDWCAVDWSDADMKFMLALKHESGGTLLCSHDAGKQFQEIGKGYGPAWIFDAQTAVVAQASSKTNPRPGLMRTTDAAIKWEPCGDYHARALPRWHKDTLYWIVEGALIATQEQGKSWKKICALKEGRMGPLFGKNDQHLFVLASHGILESLDGGQSWNTAIALPRELKGVSSLSWLEYDPIHDVLYTMKMSSELYRLQRSK